MTKTMGYARRKNRGAGTSDWKHLQKLFPLHKEHIERVRKNHAKLMVLRNRLEAWYELPVL